MSDNLIGVPPNLYRILKAALEKPREFTFPTRAAATTVRHQLYRARKKIDAQRYSLAAAFNTLSITMPRERPRADGACDAAGKPLTEWFWRIGESLLFEQLQTQLEAQLARDGVPLTAYDPPSTAAAFEPQPSLPSAPAVMRDESGLTPQELMQLAKHQRTAPRETQEDILNDVFGPTRKADET